MDPDRGRAPSLVELGSIAKDLRPVRLGDHLAGHRLLLPGLVYLREMIGSSHGPASLRRDCNAPPTASCTDRIARQPDCRRALRAGRGPPRSSASWRALVERGFQAIMCEASASVTASTQITPA